MSPSVISAIFQSTPPVKAATFFRFSADGCELFQSTPPVKAATCLLCVLSVLCYISIHAAREGGDPMQESSMLSRQLYFNPRRP